MQQDIALADNVATSYSFSTLEMIILEDAISYTFMCRNKRFMLDVCAANLEGEGGLVDQFYELKENIDDSDVLCDFETWVIDPIDEQIKRLAPAQAWSSRTSTTTLLDYYSPKTHVFELVNRDGLLEAIEHSYDWEIHGGTSPKAIVVTSSESILHRTPPAGTSHQENDRSASGGIISRSVLPTVPFIPASQLARAASPESMEEEMCEIPRIVRRVGTDQVYLFKAADERHGFQREVEILAKLQKIAEHEPGLRTSKILGLVNWDSTESILMGFLLEIIEGPTLAVAMRDASTAEKRRWMDQIDETVGMLHKYGIVWGDVKPDNVMISPSRDAVLVDFGGGCTLDYIDLELQETKEGDLQGLRKLRANLLLDS